MTAFHVFANGIFWGTWEASSKSEACQIAANEVGTDGDIKGLEAYAAGTDDDADAAAVTPVGK